MAAPAVFRSKLIIGFLFCVAAVFFYLQGPRPHFVRDSLIHTDLNTLSLSPQPTSSQPYSPPKKDWKPKELKDVNAKYAYATFLAGNDMDEVEDVYLLGARLLAYQLLHDSDTRAHESIPFVVVVTKTVSQAKIERLQREGAIVHVVEDLVAEWIYLANPDNPLNPRFKDVMTKLRLWELTQFERICLLDGDTVLTANIDGVFDDPAVQLQTNQNNTEWIRYDESPQPEKYAIASVGEPRFDHKFPPSEENDEWEFGPNYFNSGFIVFKPSQPMFDYYESLLNIDDGRWGNGLPEQNLLNWAHRRPDGNMPWGTLNPLWNIHFPTVHDIESGVKSLHEKFWRPEREDLRPYLESYKQKMLDWLRARNRAERLGLDDSVTVLQNLGSKELEEAR